MRGKEGARIRIVMGVIGPAGEIVRRIHQLHDTPAISIYAACSGLWQDLVDKEPGRVLKVVEIIQPRAVGISIVRTLAPDIDKVIVFVDPDHMGRRIRLLRAEPACAEKENSEKYLYTGWPEANPPKAHHRPCKMPTASVQYNHYK